MDESLGKSQELAPVNSDPGGPAGGLQGTQAEDDRSGADMCCNIRVDRNATWKICSSTAGNSEPENPLMLSVCGCREQESPLCGLLPPALPPVPQEMVKSPLIQDVLRVHVVGV